jgi:hypothetical protein
LPIIPIAAGAGGGIVLLIILVVILVRRNRRKDVQNRPVVAFENPMYDNMKGATGASSAPAADKGEDAQGLYDEPAFKTQTDKENPMYHSQEDLAAPAGVPLNSNFEDEHPGANEDGGSFLVSSKSFLTLVGYLDVDPEAEKAATLSGDAAGILHASVEQFNNDE